jgi:hypothetical protein
MLLVVGCVEVTVEVVLRGVNTPLAVTEWRRPPTKVRQGPTITDCRRVITRSAAAYTMRLTHSTGAAPERQKATTPGDEMTSDEDKRVA